MLKKYAFALFLLFALAPALSAQNIINKSTDETKLFLASQAFNGGEYVKALNYYKEVLASKPNDANVIFHIGECYFAMNELESAQTELEKARGIKSNAHPDLHLLLGRLYQMKGQLDLAIESYATAKTYNAANFAKTKEIIYYLEQCQTAKALMAFPKNVKVTNVGASINSPYDDKRPSITADGSTMIFTSRRPEGKTADTDREGDNKYFEDIYTSTWSAEKMNWADAEIMKGSINTEGHDAACSISPDGKQMFMYVNDMEKSRGGDIWTAKKSSTGKWGAPKNMGTGINTTFFEDGGVLSPDGNTFYFMSERGQEIPWKGQKGYGRSDIWMAKREGKSEWGDPVNLGPMVNTEYDEGGIFPAADGKTLYFCSTGHNSMGGYDIFMTRFENGNWTKPVNMGYPINTINNERMYVLLGDGKTAYLDTDREGGLGERDIWIVDLSELMKPKDGGPILSVLHGTVYDGNGKPMEVEIQILDAAGNPLNKTSSNSGGNYEVKLEGDKSYEVRIEIVGYKAIKESIKLEGTKEGIPFDLVRHFILYKE
jgi:hypothetical protein